jgi:hypothetical protein
MPIRMAKRRSNQTFDVVRRRVEKAMAMKTGKRTRGRKKRRGASGGAMTRLRFTVDAIKGRLTGGRAKRSQTARSTPRTRRREAERTRRAATARKGVRPRARAGSR